MSRLKVCLHAGVVAAVIALLALTVLLGYMPRRQTEALAAKLPTPYLAAIPMREDASPGDQLLENLATTLIESSVPTTAEDIFQKGLPLTPNARRMAYEQTRVQSTAEVVKDLGNVMTQMYGSLAVGGGIKRNPTSLSGWGLQITHHVKVLRLIEEGRDSPDSVSSMLNTAIADAIGRYNAVRVRHDQDQIAWAEGRRAGPATSDDDATYNQNRQYGDPILEFRRLHDVTYAAFYILVNIDRLRSPTLLKRWIELERPESYDALDMHVWLIDCYAESLPPDNGFLRQHLGLMGDGRPKRATVKRAHWSAPWEISDPMFVAAGVDGRDIRTISIRQIPEGISLSEQDKRAVIRSFLLHASDAESPNHGSAHR